MKNWRKHYKYE